MSDNLKTGVNYFNNNDYENAVKYFQLAAEQEGDAEAEACLGLCYYKGKGVPKDDGEARYWLSKSAAQHNDGHMCFYNRDGCLWYGQYLFDKKEYYEARRCVENVAKPGDDEAQLLYGICLLREGWYVSEGRHLTERFARQGNKEAQFELGKYYFGEDHDKAKYWYEKAAEQGHLEAMYEQYFYQDDNEKKLMYLKKSAEMGFDQAQFLLADLYAKGGDYDFDIKIEKDVEKAKYWYEKAEAQGMTRASDELKKLNSGCAAMIALPIVMFVIVNLIRVSFFS